MKYLLIIVSPFPPANVTATADFYKRVRHYGTPAQKHNLVETVWQPPLSIFGVNTPLPPGNYSLHLTPNTSKYNIASFESVAGAVTTQDVVVDHMYFNACVVDGMNIPSDFKYYLDLNEIAIQPKALGATSGEQVLDFTVPATTYAISVASQEKTAGSSTLYSPTKFKCQSDQDLNLTQLRLTYAGQTQPSPDLQVSYTGATDHLAKLYTNTLMAVGGYVRNVLETKKEFQDLGWIAHYNFMKPSGDSSTRLDLAMTMGTPTSANALVFAHHSTVAEITYSNGRVENVRMELG